MTPAATPAAPRRDTSRLRVATAAALGVGAVLAVATLLALEGREVVVLRTTDGQGRHHETRVWIADFEQASWVEAANPERPFYRDILAQPNVEIVRRGATQALRAHPVAGRAGHDLIRRLLAEKYGLADCWIGLLADTSRSIAIRLDAQT